MSTDRLSLEKKRVELLFRQNIFATIGLLGNVFAYLLISWESESHRLLTVWTLSFLAVLSVRFFVIRKINKNWNRVEDIREVLSLENIYAMGVLATGIHWGVAGSVLLTSSDVAQHAMVAFLLAGMCAAAAAGYSLSMKSFLAFVIPAGGPFALRLLWEPSRHDLIMLFLEILFFAFIFNFSRRNYKNSRNSLELYESREKEFNKLTDNQGQIAYSARMTALGEMSANIAHEINNPMASILLRIEALQSHLESVVTPDKDYLKLQIKKIENTLLVISDIIKAIHAFSHENSHIKYESTSLIEIAEGTIVLASERLKNRGIRLEKDFQFHGTITCYPSQIRQIFMNLINNAIDALQESESPHSSQWIKISLIQVEDMVEIRVSDSGPGVPEEITNKIFSPYFTTKQKGGTGLGLPMVKGIVEHHGGRIRLDPSSPHTEFVIELPLESKHLQSAA